MKIKIKNISDTKYMLELLAVYFDGSDMEKEHEKLLLKYNGSPLTPIPINRKRVY
ncbi:MAG TPA: hypothetical protein PKY81_09180 [bacterium]|nr:hypothetical protein [bacterium]